MYIEWQQGHTRREADVKRRVGLHIVLSGWYYDYTHTHTHIYYKYVRYTYRKEIIKK